MTLAFSKKLNKVLAKGCDYRVWEGNVRREIKFWKRCTMVSGERLRNNKQKDFWKVLSVH